MTRLPLMHRAVAATVAGLVGVVAVAVPASARAVEFQCPDVGGYPATAAIRANLSDAPATNDDLLGTVSVSTDGGQSWTLAYNGWGIFQGDYTGMGWVDVGGDTTKTHPYSLRWQTPGGTYTCDAMYYPIGIDAQAKHEVTRGESLTILASMSDTDYPNLTHLTAVAYLDDGSGWQDVGAARVTWFTGSALLTITPAHTGNLQLRVFDDAKDPAHEAPIGVQDLNWVLVNQPTPEIVTPGTVYAGQTATVTAWWGVGDKGYAVILERWNGDTWVYVGDSITSSGAPAVLQWKPMASYRYRLQFFADDAKGNSKVVRTSYFTVTPAFKVTVTAPASVTKNATATFTVTHKLAVPFTAYLQRWSGSSWVTVKTFVPSVTATKVTAKITSAGKYRISAAGYVSNSVIVTVK